MSERVPWFADFEVAPGEVYRHVGGDGVPASGLRLRVERLDSAKRGFWASYPGHPGKAPAFYRGFTLGSRYVREATESQDLSHLRVRGGVDSKAENSHE